MTEIEKVQGRVQKKKMEFSSFGQTPPPPENWKIDDKNPPKIVENRVKIRFGFKNWKIDPPSETPPPKLENSSFFFFFFEPFPKKWLSYGPIRDCAALHGILQCCRVYVLSADFILSIIMQNFSSFRQEMAVIQPIQTFAPDGWVGRVGSEGDYKVQPNL